MTTDTIVLKCLKCGHFLAEVGTFGRGKCCGYEITVTAVRESGLTTPKRTPTIAPTTS